MQDHTQGTQLLLSGFTWDPGRILGQAAHFSTSQLPSLMGFSDHSRTRLLVLHLGVSLKSSLLASDLLVEHTAAILAPPGPSELCPPLYFAECGGNPTPI